MYSLPKVFRIPAEKSPTSVFSITTFEKVINHPIYLFLLTGGSRGRYRSKNTVSDFEYITKATIDFIAEIFDKDALNKFISNFGLKDKLSLVPVHPYSFIEKDKKDFIFKVNSAGTSRMSLLSAIAICEYFNIDLELGVSQKERVRRTASSDLHRLSCMATFNGSVDPLKSYIVYDDHIKTGSTVSNLAGHIYQQGAKVLYYGCISNNPSEYFFPQRPETKKMLLEMYSYEAINSFFKTNFNYSASELTNEEALLLLRLEREYGEYLVDEILSYLQSPDEPYFKKPEGWENPPEKIEAFSLEKIGVSGRFIVTP